MKAVVIGACGHIGTYLVPMLIQEGYEVYAVSRGIAKPYENDPLWEKAVAVHMDREKDPGFAEKIAALQADVVIDLIGFKVSDCEAMVKVLQGTACRHYLFCSSCWVYGFAEVYPVNKNDTPAPLCDYGKAKLACEIYLREQYEKTGFPATSIRPGQISGPGWDIVGPWGNNSFVPFQKIADGEEIFLPNFGMETINTVHGYDVAQCFLKAVTHRENAVGEVFEAASGTSITLYGYAKLLYDFFGKTPRIGFLSWKEWCEYMGDPEECERTYLHIARSGAYNLERERALIDYVPKYTAQETIRQAVQSYVDRGLIVMQ